MLVKFIQGRYIKVIDYLQTFWIPEEEKEPQAPDLFV